MNETLYLILGIILLGIIFFDFFFTTLSISGAGFVSRKISLLSYMVLQYCAKIFGRSAYTYSGIIVNLSIFLIWVISIWLGLFFLYSSNPDAITNSQGVVADWVERLYFTGYVISTLGMGNFFPSTPALEMLSSIFSFFGFIFFTSSITYFLSVSSAVINQRTLARSIERLGKTPESIATEFLRLEPSYIYQVLMNFQTMLDRHVANHQAYPVIHYYSHPQPSACLGLNLVRLDEAISILLSSDKADRLKAEVKILRRALTAYLNHLNKVYPDSLPKGEGKVSSKPLNYKISGLDAGELNNRRKILRGILKSEGYEWEDISLKD